MLHNKLLSEAIVSCIYYQCDSNQTMLLNLNTRIGRFIFSKLKGISSTTSNNTFKMCSRVNLSYEVHIKIQIEVTDDNAQDELIHHS